jgi:hypothetical protein
MQHLNNVIGGDALGVVLTGNDWPDPVWPRENMSEFFFENYYATSALRPFLPPGCKYGHGLRNKHCGYRRVLHLRQGDSERDRRDIFRCPEPLLRLRAALNISRYAVFADHDAVYKGLGVPVRRTPFHSDGIATWADWVAFATARVVLFHSASGFSESAIRISQNRELGLLHTGRFTDRCSKLGIVELEVETFDADSLRVHAGRALADI